MTDDAMALCEAREALLAIAGAALDVVRSLGGISSVRVFAIDEDEEPFAEVVAYDLDSRAAFGFHHDFFDRGDRHE